MFPRTESVLKEVLSNMYVSFSVIEYVITDYTNFVYGECMQAGNLLEDAQKFKTTDDADRFINHNRIYEGWKIVPLEITYKLKGG